MTSPKDKKPFNFCDSLLVHKLSREPSSLDKHKLARQQTSFLIYNKRCSNKKPSTNQTFKIRWKEPLLSNVYFDFTHVQKILFMCLFLLAFISPVKSQGAFEVWENEVSVDTNRRFVVQWTPTEDAILFRLTAKTRGYVGFGFHTQAKMDGADIVVG